jgi:gliding motility-associated-like protein
MGCDSIATLNLSVNNFSTSTTNVTVCNSAFPYSWNGQTYNAAGTYTVTLVGSSGCDSIATLNLAVNNFSTSTTNITVCNSALPYSWNGQTYNSAGTYSVTLVGSTGCDSIATLNLAVNNFSTSTTNITICNSSLPYSWNGQTYNAAGTYTVTLVGSMSCDSIATLNLGVNNFSTSTTNVTVCNSALPYSWNGQTYNSAGTYTVTLVGSTGCDSIATLNLAVNNFSTSTTNITVCNSALPYSWNGQTYNSAGTYSITLTGSTGCDSIATLNLSVNSFSTSTTNIAVCNSALPYSWNGQTYIAAGTYTVTLVGSMGCDSIATLNLSVNNFSTSTTNVTVCNSALPYSWNGQTYNAAGTYTVTLVGSMGCDSIATLNLAVNNFSTSTTNISVCNSALPYSWNGQTYNSAGTYNITLTGSAGCDSIATLNLAVNNFSASTTNITVCNSALPYSWNGQTYNSAGTYTVTLVGSMGCDSIATLNLSVNNFSTSTTNITVCNSALPYSWNGQTYNSAGTYNITLTGSTGCDSIATLNLSVNNFSTSTTNITVCNSVLPYSWNGQTYNSAGTYAVTLVGSSGCDSIATLTLKVNQPSVSQSQISVCTSQLPYTWNGILINSAGNYSVTLVNSTGCDSVANLNVNILPSSSSNYSMAVCLSALPISWNGQTINNAGIYQYTTTNSTGCDSVAHLTLTLLPDISDTFHISTCAAQLPYLWNGQSIQASGHYTSHFNASNGCDSVVHLYFTVIQATQSHNSLIVCRPDLPVQWQGQTLSTPGTYHAVLTNAEGCDSLLSLSLIVHDTTNSLTTRTICSAELPYAWNGQNFYTSGSYLVILSNTQGCDSMARLQLQVNQTPGTPVVQSPLTFCQYDAPGSILTYITPPQDLIWYGTATGGTGSGAIPQISTMSPGTTHFYVSTENQGCESGRADLQITVNQKPSLGPDKSAHVCEGDSLNLITQFNVSGINFSWGYVFQPLQHLIVKSPGLYTLTAWDTNGCADTAMFRLFVMPLPVADAGPDTTVEFMQPYTLHGNGGGDYLWSPAQFLNNPHSQNPVVTPSGDMSLILKVTDQYGCSDTDQVKLRILKGPGFYIPTAFSPNGDGLNDVFRPTSVGIARLDYFQVFNRYGELVFSTLNPKEGWDGNYKGLKQPIGNYVWVIRGLDRLGVIREMRGNVVLIR